MVGKSLPMSTWLSPHHVDGEADLRTAQNGGAVSMKIRFLYLSKKPLERLPQNDGFIRFFNAKKAPPMCEKTKRRLTKRSMVPPSINRAMLMVVSMARSRFRVKLNCSMRRDGPAEPPRPDGPQWEHQIAYRLVIINNKGKAARCPEGVRRYGYSSPRTFAAVRPVGWASACAHNIQARGYWRIGRRNHKSVSCPYRKWWTSRYRKRVWKNLEKSGDVRAGAPFGHRSLRSPPSLVRWGFSCSSCGPARIDCRTPYNKGPRLR